MDLHDDELDAWIQLAAQPAALISAQQKQAAWESLRRKAAHQTMLPPISKRMAVGTWFADGFSALGRWFYLLMVEEGRYQRACNSRVMLRYSGSGLCLTSEFMRSLTLTTLNHTC